MNNVRDIIQPKKHNVWDICYEETWDIVDQDLRVDIWNLITENKDKFNQDVNLWFKINKI